MAMPLSKASRGEAILYRRPVDENATRIRLVDAVQNLEDGRFAGAILADQADNFALPDREAHLVERLHPWERIS